MRSTFVLHSALRSSLFVLLRYTPLFITCVFVSQEYLRSLPGSLLDSRLYRQWIEASAVSGNRECRERITRLLAELPPMNRTLLGKCIWRRRWKHCLIESDDLHHLQATLCAFCRRSPRGPPRTRCARPTWPCASARRCWPPTTARWPRLHNVARCVSTIAAAVAQQMESVANSHEKLSHALIDSLDNVNVALAGGLALSALIDSDVRPAAVSSECETKAARNPCFHFRSHLLDSLSYFTLLLLSLLSLASLAFHLLARHEISEISSLSKPLCWPIVSRARLPVATFLLTCCFVLLFQEVSKSVPKLIAYLIDHCTDLYGDGVLRLYGSPPTSATATTAATRSDSGAEEESDSLNSLQENHSSTNDSENSSDRARRDDSSIDSLEREDSDESSSSGPRRPLRRPVVLTRVKSNHTPQSPFTKTNKMSLSNLSRDSGLTLSDTQLYNNDDDEVTREASASVSPKPASPASGNMHKSLTKSVSHLEAVEFENALNVTYSYGRSVGVSIDGSCHDVVRKRKHAGLFNEKEARHRSSTPPRPSLIAAANNNQNNARRGNCAQRSANIVLHKAEVHHRPLNMSKSFANGIDEESTENIITPTSTRPGQTHYRFRRPPLTALLSTPVLRKTASEESLTKNEQFDVNYNKTNTQTTEPMSLPYVPATPPSSNDASPTTPTKSGQRIGSICSSSSETPSQRSIKSSLSSCSLRSNPLSVQPPSYQEAMSRKEQLARLHNHLSTSSRDLNHPNLYEQSLRVYTADLVSGANRTLRAVPVRVAVDAPQVAKVVHVPSGDVVCRQERPQVQSMDVVDGVRSPPSSNVAVETRCAKDTTEDWRKDIHWSVAHLRTLFNGQRATSSQTHRPVAASRSVLVKPNYIDRIDGRYKKSLVCRSSLDLSVTSGHATNYNNNNLAVSNKNHVVKDNPCVTVIHVTQAPQLTVHSRCDSLSSGGEESYV